MQHQAQINHQQSNKPEIVQPSIQLSNNISQPIKESLPSQNQPINSQQQNIIVVNEQEPVIANKEQTSAVGDQQPINIANEEQQQNGEDNDNESSWTDATESIAADGQDQIWVVDDDIINAMDLDSDQQGQEEHQKEGQSEQGSSSKQQGSNEVDLEQLEEQFVKGNESNEDWRLGKHDKFCTFVAVSQDGKSIFTGGGDDQMLCFREEQGQWKQFYRLKHTQTVSKIQISHDSKYVVSFTQNQAYCTELSTLQSVKFDIEQPSQLVCHKQGGVALIANQYTVSIYNLKGLSLYTSYTLDLAPTILAFCDKGKQIIAVGENKLRIITPKTGQIVKGNGQFHKEEISALVTGNNMIFTGCIEGKIFVSNLNKGTVIGQLEPFKNTINHLFLSDNNQYVLVAPQGEGVHWIETTKMKRLFHHPKDISVTDIVQVQAPTIIAVADLSGRIHIIDRRNPMETIKFYQAGNTIHKLSSRGSFLYAACEDGCMRVFDVSK